MAIRQQAPPPTRSSVVEAATHAQQSGAHRPVPHPARPFGRSDLPARAAGAVAALLIAVVHVVDQGGLSSLKHPVYVGVGYWLLEVTAVAVAVALLAGGAQQRLAGWWLAVSVAAGPILGYALSRGPGLPGYTDDRGNWTEAIGVQALVSEAALLALAGWVLWRHQQAQH